MGNTMQQAAEPTESPGSLTADKLNTHAKQYLLLIAKKDESALADFYDATLGKVYALALYISGEPEAAEEIVEDVYMQVWRDAAKYDHERARVMTWLQTICRSRALDYLRRNDKADTHPDPHSLNKEEQFEENDPSDLLMAIDRNSVVHSALQELLPVQRQLLMLAFFKEMSHQQISDHIQMPLGTVKTHIRKAISCLREHPSINDQRVAL